MLKKESISEIESVIGYTFKDKKLISQAFIRSSYSYEHPEDQDNELLELLGDSVLSLIVTTYLFDRYVYQDGSGLYSGYSEGELSAIRSNLVNKSFLAKRIRDLDLGYMLKMGMSDNQPGIKKSKSILEDLFESIVGAIYLDTNKNLKKTSNIVCNLLNIQKELDEFDGIIRVSYKNELQEWCQKYGLNLPRYDTYQMLDEYRSLCIIPEYQLSQSGIGHNKKEAENDAAKKLIDYINKSLEIPADKEEVTREKAINILQEYCRDKGYDLPVYDMISDEIDEYNDHYFIVRCYVEGLYTDGEGTSKKYAKKDAAYEMLKRLRVVQG